MDRINLTDNGGFPLEQDTLGFMQMSYTNPLSGIAKLCGDKTILSGVNVIAGNVTAGWISFNGELIPFQSCPLLSKVSIVEVPTAVTFEDGELREEYFTRVAKCSLVGDFDFSELVPLLSLQNVWRPGNIKEHYCNVDYIAANFDPITGKGTGAEAGWQILSKAYPDTAGKTFVNIAFGDPLFGVPGNTGGEKTHTLTPTEQGHIKFRGRADDGDGDTGNYRSMAILEIGGVAADVSGLGNAQYTAYKLAALENDAQPHSNLQPYFVILKLIKL